MTVGIGAICDREEDPKVIVAADKMVTYGTRAGVEYEDASTKVKRVADTESVNAVAVGAGYSSYIDDIIDWTYNTVHHDDGGVRTMDALAQYAVAAYQERVRDAIKNHVLSPYDYTMEDFRDPECYIPPTIETRIVERTESIVEKIGGNVSIIVGGVGEGGPGLYEISNMDYTRQTPRGHAVVGSGQRSALLTFIRREYSQYTSYEDGVFTVLDAKRQAEERQGVGKEMDLVSVSSSGCHRFSEEKKAELRQQLLRIDDAEQEARDKVLEEWEPTNT